MMLITLKVNLMFLSTTTQRYQTKVLELMPSYIECLQFGDNEKINNIFLLEKTEVKNAT